TLDRLAVRPGVRRARQHRVLGGDPALARALPPARHALGHRCSAQHPGIAELDQHRAFGVLQPPAGHADGAELVGGAAVGSTHTAEAICRTGHRAPQRLSGPSPGNPPATSAPASEEEPMAQTVGEYLLQRLREWGGEQVFGYPGDGINAIVAAFGAAGNEPRFVQSRHEEMSAFEAVGYAKFSGATGVCLATSGPGAVHLLNGLYDAKLDHVPVV